MTARAHAGVPKLPLVTTIRWVVIGNDIEHECRMQVESELFRAINRAVPGVRVATFGELFLNKETLPVREGIEVYVDGPFRTDNPEIGRIQFMVDPGNGLDRAKGYWLARHSPYQPLVPTEPDSKIRDAFRQLLTGDLVTEFALAMRDAEALLAELLVVLDQNHQLQRELERRDVEIEFLREQLRTVSGTLAESHRTSNPRLAARAVAWTGALLLAAVGGAVGGLAQATGEAWLQPPPAVSEYVVRCQQAALALDPTTPMDHVASEKVPSSPPTGDQAVTKAT
jgi:hypothetical protein